MNITLIQKKIEQKDQGGIVRGQVARSIHALTLVSTPSMAPGANYPDHVPTVNISGTPPSKETKRERHPANSSGEFRTLT